MDSLTRIAHAKREVGLALGEQPTSKGYPPSVISMIPNLIERTGAGSKNEGTITSFYTILADSDDTNDPVVDTARAILMDISFYLESLPNSEYFLRLI